MHLAAHVTNINKPERRYRKPAEIGGSTALQCHNKVSPNGGPEALWRGGQPIQKICTLFIGKLGPPGPGKNRLLCVYAPRVDTPLYEKTTYLLCFWVSAQRVSTQRVCLARRVSLKPRSYTYSRSLAAQTPMNCPESLSRPPPQRR